MSEHIRLSIALCRIGFYTCLRTLCCKGPPTPRPEYDVVCIGLSGAGKTALLSRLCSEGIDGIVPTTGFSIKAVPFPNAVLNVKELGAGGCQGASNGGDDWRLCTYLFQWSHGNVQRSDNIKKYWSRYYQGSQGVVFVLDSTVSDEEMEACRSELHLALQHPQLCTLPFLILANHQDSPTARAVPEIKKYFELEPLARGKRWILEGSTINNMEAVRESFSQLIRLLEEKELRPGRI
ncbi:ADP-ribosylation factor-like protein 15a isoform X1 [Pygocentrus nattereri]|uniref:ADP-ribosylation factor-like protein 15a isoform X1 n=1 Tax=Pygocentrus nattereri TaxID=42514 RepID=UPI0018918D91|nr:ADP-ribosylation factor-like protein 15a isoform X1 [Pygocentrus nattereri]